MKKIILTLLVSTMPTAAMASVETILDCHSPASVDSLVKRLTVERLKNGNFRVAAQSAWDDRLIEKPVLKALSGGDGYDKLVLVDDGKSTVSLIMLHQGKVERAVLITEGSGAPLGKEFGTTADFLDCN